jgi:uncharacterized protein (DUF697 family)
MFKKLYNWLGKKQSEQKGSTLTKVLIGTIMAFVAILFLIEFAPILEAAVTASTATNTLTVALIGMSEWIVPAAGLIAVFVGAFAIIRSRRG